MKGKTSPNAEQEVRDLVEKKESGVPATEEPREVRKFKGAEAHEWFDNRNLREFNRSYKAMELSLLNGFLSQAELRKSECLNIILKDESDHAVRLAREIGLRRVDRFAAIYPGNRSISVKVGRTNWRINPIDDFEKPIPLEHLEALTKLRQAGVEFDGFGIAMPAPRVKRDPRLLARIGRFWLEIGRWD